jgi:hypothetical protein
LSIHILLAGVTGALLGWKAGYVRGIIAALRHPHWRLP